MRIAFLFFICLFLPFIVFAQNSDSQNIGASFSTTRYIIFSGTYLVKAEGKTVSEQGVFKVDTYTGKTWRLKVERKSEAEIFEWVPIDDNEVSQIQTPVENGSLTGDGEGVIRKKNY